MKPPPPTHTHTDMTSCSLKTQMFIMRKNHNKLAKDAANIVSMDTNCTFHSNSWVFVGSVQIWAWILTRVFLFPSFSHVTQSVLIVEVSPNQLPPLRSGLFHARPWNAHIVWCPSCVYLSCWHCAWRNVCWSRVSLRSRFSCNTSHKFSITKMVFCHCGCLKVS